MRVRALCLVKQKLKSLPNFFRSYAQVTVVSGKMPDTSAVVGQLAPQHLAGTTRPCTHARGASNVTVGLFLFGLARYQLHFQHLASAFRWHLLAIPRPFLHHKSALLE